VCGGAKWSKQQPNHRNVLSCKGKVDAGAFPIVSLGYSPPPSLGGWGIFHFIVYYIYLYIYNIYKIL